MKVVVIAGESASGKDTVLNILVEQYGWHKMVSYTTRPPRDGEVEGKDYFFLASNEEFDRLLEEGKLFEKTSYTTEFGVWNYGIGQESVEDDVVNVVVLNPHGIEQLKELPQFKESGLKVVYITAPLITRIKRYLSRDNLEAKHKIELVDRILRDHIDFENKQWHSTFNHKFLSEGESTPEDIAWAISRLV